MRFAKKILSIVMIAMMTISCVSFLSQDVSAFDRQAYMANRAYKDFLEYMQSGYNSDGEWSFVSA